MRRKGFREAEILKEQKMKNEIARKQWIEVLGVLGICAGALIFFFAAYCHAVGLLGGREMNVEDIYVELKAANMLLFYATQPEEAAAQTAFINAAKHRIWDLMTELQKVVNDDEKRMGEEVHSED